jgi:YggT family protein
MTTFIAAIDRSDVADYVSALFLVYLILILIRVLLSWIPRMPYNPVLNALVTFIHDVTDPYLGLFRRILPPVGGGGFALDLSPIVAILVLVVVRAIVVGVIDPG